MMQQQVKLCKVCDFLFPPDFNGILSFNSTCGIGSHKGKIMTDNAEFLALCNDCDGKGFMFKNYRNDDGSITNEEKNCPSCKGKGAVVETRIG